MSLCRLTVYFEDLFWIGLFELEDGSSYRVAKHVFGAEPANPEIFNFICIHFSHLHFSDKIQCIPQHAHHNNPKMQHRQINREMKSNAQHATKAQLLLTEQLAKSKESKKRIAKERKFEKKNEQFVRKIAKRR